MPKTRSIGHDIERWWEVNGVQIPGTKNALYRAFLDSLAQPPRTEIGVGNKLSWKAKKRRKLPREKVLLEL
jgi:hypothetical protein